MNHNNLADFIWDEHFRDWVLNPKAPENEYWKTYAKQNPEKIDLLNQAKSIVCAIKIKNAEFSDAEIENAIIEIKAKIDQNEVQTKKSFYRKPWIRVAAIFVMGFITMGAAWLLFQYNSSSKSELSMTNYTSKPMAFKLPDGSLVILGQQSEVKYPSKFNPSKREIWLSGEAYFEITKNPKQPFFVYANEIVTKVLGTSFTIKALPDDDQITVEVTTGNVAVESAKAFEKQSDFKMGGTVLRANQKLVFERKENQMSLTETEKPIFIDTKISSSDFVFEDTPTSEVFTMLSKAYDIEIDYNKNIFENCPLTATLSNLELFEKLDIICKAVNAHYEMVNGKIKIKGEGCKNQ